MEGVCGRRREPGAGFKSAQELPGQGHPVCGDVTDTAATVPIRASNRKQTPSGWRVHWPIRLSNERVTTGQHM